MDPATFATASAGLIAGAMSGLHCGAMCGGIASAHAAVPAMIPLRRISPVTSASMSARPIVRNLAFNAGRIMSYTVAGALAGGVGGATLIFQDSLLPRQILFALANTMLVALGLYVAGWWRGITVLERGGALLWRRIQPAAVLLLKSPASDWRDSLALGAVWGWIPCGLVYAMLVSAIASGNAGNGALVMLAFGLGTLPNLLLIGWGGNQIGSLLQRPAFRAAAGVFIIGFGLVGLTRLPELSKLDAWGALCQPVVTHVRAWLPAV